MHHGSLNLSALFILLILGEIIILIFILITKLFRSKRYLKLFLFLFLIIISIAYFYVDVRDKYFCKNWGKGINGTFINNDESLYSCSIKIPKKKCLIDILSPFLDISKILHNIQKYL